MFTEHESVEQSRRLQTEPIDLYECFKAFTKEEELGEDELWSVVITLFFSLVIYVVRRFISIQCKFVIILYKLDNSCKTYETIKNINLCILK